MPGNAEQPDIIENINPPKEYGAVPIKGLHRTFA